ncbi:hypothetical protein RvY_04227 [Ramazzottius varieornatus]|uniref:DOMON domain-containing protein n=1 Tax=Ramazzottius varieornatus TaxID=947166 RepID=A0A1D1UQW1_RAMVA|nr:hypothetical protein RvY_04227 [Ramazzottius varieornatus]
MTLYWLRVFLVVFGLVSRTLAIELDKTQILGSMANPQLSPACTGEQSTNLLLQWGTNDSHIEVQLTYPTVGWMAMGLSPDGGMNDSDVLWGYVNDTTNAVIIQDRYLVANLDTMTVKLVPDTQQDWRAVTGNKNATHTVLRAGRKLVTGDTLQDRPFTNMAQPVIFSFSRKPPNPDSVHIKKHDFASWTRVTFLQDKPAAAAAAIRLNRMQHLSSELGDRGPCVEWGTNSTHIEVQLTYPTLGWMAFGLSPNGGMNNADVLWGYVNDTSNEVVIQDRFLTVKMDQTPPVQLRLDDQQDWIAIGGSKNLSHTVLRAARQLATGDSMDRPFTNSDQPVIFSFHNNTPEFFNGPFKKHSFRGATSVNFLKTSEVTAVDEPGFVLIQRHGSQKIVLNQTKELVDLLSDVGSPKNPTIEWGTNDTHIEMQLTYPTRGWLALGLSPDGGMDGADVLFGYINDTTNEVVLQDRSLMASLEEMMVKLTLDKIQNWKVVGGSKNATHTVLRACRMLRTGPFTGEDQFVIFSYNRETPDSMDGPIQKHHFRGVVTMNFLNTTPPVPKTLAYKEIPSLNTEVTKQLDFLMDNRTIEGNADTNYYCKMIPIPLLDKKYHTIATQPVVNTNNTKFIHHMLMYACASKLPEEITKVTFFDCGPTHPDYVMQHCQNLLGAWAMGSKPTEYYPEDAGLPFTTEMSGMHMILQIHYNNPERARFVDDSGFRFLLSEKLRKYDAGVIMAGVLSFDFTMTIPPGQTSFRLQSQCSDQCTAAALPSDGINIFNGILHMHTRGRSAVARHFRGSQEITPPIVKNMNFDFNYQTSQAVQPTRKFLPGDRAVLECTFSTVNETQPVFGGESTREEMCLVFLFYYPKVDLNMCGSRYKVEKYLDAIGLRSNTLMRRRYITQTSNETMAHVFMPSMKEKEMLRYKNLIDTLKRPVRMYLGSQTWSEQDAKPLQDLYSSYSKGSYHGICKRQWNSSLVLVDKVPDIPPYVEPAVTY